MLAMAKKVATAARKVKKRANKKKKIKDNSEHAQLCYTGDVVELCYSAEVEALTWILRRLANASFTHHLMTLLEGPETFMIGSDIDYVRAAQVWIVNTQIALVEHILRLHVWPICNERHEWDASRRAILDTILRRHIISRM
jgi:hypothetical protein